MSENAFAEGHCLCGAIQLSLKAAPQFGAQCHCDHCQRASGTGHMSIAFFREEDVSVIGELKGYAAETDTGSVNTRYFCPECGSRVLSRNTARAGMIGIAVGVLNNHDWFKPNRVVYQRNQAAWDLTDPSIPHFEMMPPISPASGHAQ